MKKRTKGKVRWLSVLLTGCLLLSVIPATAFAAEDTVATESKDTTAEETQLSGQEDETEKSTTGDVTPTPEQETNAKDSKITDTSETDKNVTEEKSKTSEQQDAAEESTGKENNVKQSEKAEERTSENVTERVSENDNKDEKSDAANENSSAEAAALALEQPKPDYLPQGVTYSTDYAYAYHTQVIVTANVSKDSGPVVELTRSTGNFLKGNISDEALQTAFKNLVAEIETPYKSMGTVTSKDGNGQTILDHFERTALYTFTPTSGEPVDFKSDLKAAKQYFNENPDAAGIFTNLLDVHEYRTYAYTYDLIVQKNSQLESPITSIAVENAKFDYQPGDAPRATAEAYNADADKYEIAYECWLEFENNEPVAAWYSDNGSHGSLPTFTKFESGKRYVYSVMLKPKDGYSFDSEVSATVNWDVKQNVSPESGGKFLYVPAVKTITMPTIKVIDVVEVNGVTASFKDGDKPVFTGNTPDGVHYMFRCEWWELDSNTGLVSTEPKWGSDIYKNKIAAFEAGKTYHYGVFVSAEGDVGNVRYVFGPDTKLKINGEFVNYKRSDNDISDFSDGTTMSMWVLTDLAMIPEAGGTTPSEKYTVTYTDGRGGIWFADEVHSNLTSGTQTPVYNNGVEPTREGYIFKGWLPTVTDTVTGNATYTAQWESKSKHLLKELLSNIKVECINDSNHTFKEYDTSVGGYSAITLEGENGKFTSTITVEAKKYIDRYNEDTDEIHQLVVGEAETQTIVLEFNNNYDKESVIVKSGTLPVTFKVTCAQPQPDQKYTVTYTDGVEGEEVFKDQTYTVESGKATPAFNGTPTRKGYTFAGWKPLIAATVTGNATYEATWRSNSATTTPSDNKPNTGETTSPKTGDTGNGKNSTAPAENKSDTVTTPKTGDTSNIVLWITLLFVSSGALVSAVVIFKKKKYNR